VTLGDELAGVAAAAAAFADEGEELAGVIAAEPVGGGRVYLCSYAREGGRRWLALDDVQHPIRNRSLVREAAAIAALCEIAEESAGGGDLEELRSQLMTLRVTESPEGIEEAQAAALELERTIVPPPRVASAVYLDAIGDAARRLEHALGTVGHSPFAAAMQAAAGVVDELTADVESAYKLELR
jgi:hypothetical protein